MDEQKKKALQEKLRSLHKYLPQEQTGFSSFFSPSATLREKSTLGDGLMGKLLKLFGEDPDSKKKKAKDSVYEENKRKVFEGLFNEKNRTGPGIVERTGQFVGDFLQKTPDTTIRTPPQVSALTTIANKLGVPIPSAPKSPLLEFVSGLPGEQARSYGRNISRATSPKGREELMEGLKKLPAEVLNLDLMGLFENPATEFAFDAPDFLPGGFLLGSMKNLGKKGVKELTEKTLKESAEKGINTGSKIKINIKDFKQELSTGRFVGSPGEIKTKEALYDLHKRMLEKAEEGALGKDWYRDSSKAILEMFQGDVESADKFSKLLAIYSPNSTPKYNLQMALRAWGQYTEGLPISGGGMKARDVVANKVLYNNESWSGLKTNAFYNNLTRDFLNPDDKSVTIDLWAARSLGYKTDAPSEQQYKFSEKVIKNVGDYLGWNPDEVQAAMWLTERSHKLNKPITELSPGGFADVLKDRFAKVTMEHMPSVDGGLFPELHNADWQTKMEFHSGVEAAWLDKGKDELARMLKLPVADALGGSGVYMGKVSPGQQLTVPVILQPGKTKYGTFKVKAGDTVEALSKKYKVSPEVILKSNPDIKPGMALPKEINIPPQLDENYLKRMKQYAAIRGKLTAQDSIGWHVMLEAPNIESANGYFVELGELLPKDAAEKLDKALMATKANDKYFIAPSEDKVGGLGFNLVKYNDGMTNKEFHDIIDPILKNLFPEAKVGGYTAPNGLIGLYGEDYDSIIKETSPDIQNWIRNVQSPKIEDFYRKFGQKHGFTDNRTNIPFSSTGNSGLLQ